MNTHTHAQLTQQPAIDRRTPCSPNSTRCRTPRGFIDRGESSPADRQSGPRNRQTGPLKPSTNHSAARHQQSPVSPCRRIRPQRSAPVETRSSMTRLTNRFRQRPNAPQRADIAGSSRSAKIIRRHANPLPRFSSRPCNATSQPRSARPHHRVEEAADFPSWK